MQIDKTISRAEGYGMSGTSDDAQDLMEVKKRPSSSTKD